MIRPPLLSEVIGFHWRFADSVAATLRYCDAVLVIGPVGDCLREFFVRADLVVPDSYLFDLAHPYHFDLAITTGRLPTAATLKPTAFVFALDLARVLTVSDLE